MHEQVYFTYYISFRNYKYFEGHVFIHFEITSMLGYTLDINRFNICIISLQMVLNGFSRTSLNIFILFSTERSHQVIL